MIRHAWFLLILTGGLLHAQEATRPPFRLVPDDRASRSTFSVGVADSVGTVLYRIQREQFFDTAPPAVHLFGNGSAVLMDGYAGVIEFYDGSGTMINRLLIRDALRPEHERVIAWAGAESKIAFVISEPNEDDALVLFTDNRGTPILRKALAGRSHASAVRISSDGTLLALGTFSWNETQLSHHLDLLSADGRILGSVPLEFSGGSFGPGDSLLLAYGSTSASLVRISDPLVVSSLPLGKGSVVHDAVWNADTALIAYSGKPDFINNEWISSSVTVASLSADGKQRVVQFLQQAFRNAKLERTEDGVSILFDGRRVTPRPTR